MSAADIGSFIADRLAEAQAAAEAAYNAEIDPDPDEVVRWRSSGGEAVYLDGRHSNLPIAVGPWDCGMNEAIVEHIVHWDPVRVLAEIKAKRKLLAGHEGVHRCDWGEHRGGELEPCTQAKLLAAPDAGHPDYDPTWSVEA